MKEIIYQDSYTEKLDKGNLKCYLDMTDLKACEEKLKHFVKIKNFINALNKIAI